MTLGGFFSARGHSRPHAPVWTLPLYSCVNIRCGPVVRATQCGSARPHAPAWMCLYSDDLILHAIFRNHLTLPEQAKNQQNIIIPACEIVYIVNLLWLILYSALSHYLNKYRHRQIMGGQSFQNLWNIYHHYTTIETQYFHHITENINNIFTTTQTLKGSNSVAIYCYTNNNKFMLGAKGWQY